MKDTVKEYLESSKKHSSRSRKLVAILLVLSLVTATGVSWSLHKQGQSMAMDAKCGQEEHTHTPECFTRELICGKQETAGHTHSDSCYQEGELICQEQEAEAHTHSDACYRETLTCSKPVHTHTLQCYSDPAADVETAEVWEEPIKKLELTGDYGKDVVAVAKTQLGYQESQNNYQAAEDGQTKKGWNRYGAWYGNPYADWDATFASFCLNYAKVPNYPLSDNAAKWVEKLSEQSLYVTAEGASEGCLVFLDKNEDQAPDHVGIVEEIKDGEVKVIEGDMNDVVQSNTYQLNDPRITGFGKLPAKIDENAAVTKTVECGDYTITVTYDSSANIPENAVLQAYDLTYAMTEEEMAGLAKDGKNFNGLFKLDIGFYVNGVEIEPAQGSAVDVKIVKNGGYGIEGTEKVDIIHEKKDGTTEVLSSQTGSENAEAAADSVKFQTESFSLFTGGWYSSPSDDSGNDGGNGSGAGVPVATAETGGSVGGTVIPAPSYSKYVLDKKDGSYDLTLNVIGAQGTETQKQKLDIILILDTSSSMDKNSKFTNLKNAVSDLFNKLKTNNQIDPRLQIVSYDYSARVNANRWLTTDDTAAVNYILGKSQTSVSGMTKLATAQGTNYQAALYTASQLQSSCRPDAISVVMFLSDGEPSASTVVKTTSSDREYDFSKSSGTNSGYWKLQNGGTNYSNTLGKSEWNNPSYNSSRGYNGGSVTIGSKTYNTNNNLMYLNGAKMAAQLFNTSYFYAVGFGTSAADTTHYPIPGNNNFLTLNALEAVAAATGSAVTGAQEVGTDGLGKYFDEFIEKITSINVENVNITDTLSNYAQFNSDNDVVTLTYKNGSQTLSQSGTIANPPTLTVDKVTKDAQGQEVHTSYDLSVAVDPATKTFQLVFPAEYSLDKDAVYSVTVNVKPTEQAYTEYGQSGYPHTGDDKTDDPAVPAGQETSSNKAGFYSNVNEAARLTYTITGDSQPYAVNYQKPVIQVKPVVDFKIQKTKEDGTTPLDGAQFALYKQDGQTKKYYSVDESGTVSWVDTETNLPKASGSNSLFEAGNLENGTYYVKETAVPNGYYPLDTELKVVVADGTLTVEKVKGTGTIPVAKDTSQPPHTVYTATVANYTGYNLPDTGGSGTSMFTMIGLLLLGFGLVYGFFSRCKSEGGLG